MALDVNIRLRTATYRGIPLSRLVPKAAQAFKEMLWVNSNSAMRVFLSLELLCDTFERQSDAKRAEFLEDFLDATELDADIYMVIPFFLRQYFAEAVEQLAGQPVIIPLSEAQNGFAQRVTETLIKGDSKVTFDTSNIPLD